MEKTDFKKSLKEFYQPNKKEFSVVEVPKFNFLMIDGRGDPNNSKEFQDAVQVLYGVTFTIKMMPKSGNVPEGYFEYVVPPLEGLWWTEGKNFDIKQKNKWKWRLMIMQPEFVTKKLVEKTAKILKERKNPPALSKLKFESFCEGLSVQIMHVGPYSEEPETIAKMKKFMEENNLIENGLHHEIYLSDPRRTAPEKLRTILRQPVKKQIS